MRDLGIKYLSLFSGVGGFEVGIQRAIPEAECIGFSEIDKYAVQTYLSHFKEHINYGDVTKINPKGLRDFNLLVGGFPCQSFSVAGKRGGFNDTRGTMFFEIARILADKKPQHLLLENVKGLLSHDEGRTFQTVLGVLADLGYRVEWQVLNSKDFGVPQNRERVLIIGHLGACCGRQVFPLGSHNGQAYEAGDTTSAGTQRFIKTRHLSQNGTLLSDSITLQASEIAHIVLDGSRIRRLTPIECERLQGFPDNWTQGVSDTQRYKQMGNAVTVNVIEAVVAELAKLGCSRRTIRSSGRQANSEMESTIKKIGGE